VICHFYVRMFNRTRKYNAFVSVLIVTYTLLYFHSQGVNAGGVRLSPCRRRWRRRRRREGNVITHARIPRRSRPRSRNRLTGILTVRRPASSASRCISILVVRNANHSHSYLFICHSVRPIYLMYYERDASDAPLKRARLTAPLAESGQSIESERVFVRVQSVPSVQWGRIEDRKRARMKQL